MILHSHDYDSRYYPAMPAIEMQIGRRAGQAAITMTAIVDSGADATMIPLQLLRKLRARKGATRWLVGIAGERYEVNMYTVAVQIGEQFTHYVEVVGTERQQEAIIGRDLLNHYVVTLDGPAHSVVIST